jgi:uncharacterized protein (DUF1697 family)
MASSGRVVVLLRGVNVGRAKRISMSDFAALLGELGVTEVRTLLNSGNAVGSTSLAPASLARAVEAAIESRLGFTCDVVVRTRSEVAAVVAHDPLAEVATDPSRYLVVFLGSAPTEAAVATLRELDLAPEEWVLDGRELYLWMPSGVAESVASKHLAKGVLGVTWTGRNVATVRKILDAM